MKSSVRFRLRLLLLLLLVPPLTRAQTRPTASDRAGYWNLEINRTTRDYTLVRFYNGQDQLLSEERLDGVCLDLARRGHRTRRTQRQLNVALQQVLRAPAAAQTTTALALELGRPRR